MTTFTSRWLTWERGDVPGTRPGKKNCQNRQNPGDGRQREGSGSFGGFFPRNTFPDTCATCGDPTVVAWGSDSEAFCRGCWTARIGSRADSRQPTASLAEVHASLTPEEHARLVGEALGGDPLAQFMLDAVACTPGPSAWRLYSRRLDRELWVARDGEAAARLDRDGARGGLPVLLAADLERLRDVDDQRLGDLLDLLAVFPGARLAQLEPEVAS
jgi:hypothetical protein